MLQVRTGGRPHPDRLSTGLPTSLSPGHTQSPLRGREKGKTLSHGSRSNGGGPSWLVCRRPSSTGRRPPPPRPRVVSTRPSGSGPKRGSAHRSAPGSPLLFSGRWRLFPGEPLGGAVGSNGGCRGLAAAGEAAWGWAWILELRREDRGSWGSRDPPAV